jgi:hypothetical protein
MRKEHAVMALKSVRDIMKPKKLLANSIKDGQMLAFNRGKRVGHFEGLSMAIDVIKNMEERDDL